MECWEEEGVKKVKIKRTMKTFLVTYPR